MPNFQPSGNIKIGRVPFDNSYRHTMTFSSTQAQQSYFESVCTQGLSKNDYTYVRMNNAIKVPFNAESLYTYNYVMYQNANYGSKWFYAFIIDVNYVNESTTELVLQLDVMQTWYFDYTLVEGFVEREHVSDDTIGAHLNPEPDMPFNLVCMDDDRNLNFTRWAFVVQTTSWPSEFYGVTFTQEGGIYDNVFNGCKLYAWDDQSTDDMASFVKKLQDYGSGDAISNIYMVPHKMLEGRIEGDHSVTRGNRQYYQTVEVEMPSTLDGYAPRNNKLLTYPYSFFRVTDGNGNSSDLKWELWDSMDLFVSSSLDPDAFLSVFPTKYAGTNANLDVGINVPITGRCSWISSPYANWSAQNAVANALTIGTGVMMASTGIGAGAAAASAELASARAAVERMPVAERTIRQGGRINAAHSFSEAMKPEGYVGAGILGGMLGTVSRQGMQPNRTSGQASGNSMIGQNLKVVHLQKMCLQEEFARIVDDFFDMYGYQVDRVKVPNRTGRPYWNYVKMQNSCHRGNVPADDMAAINEIYNRGITFWHTADIGNYSLSNQA